MFCCTEHEELGITDFMSFLQTQQNCSFRSICQMKNHLLHSGISPCREIIVRIKEFQRGSFIGTFYGSHTQVDINSVADQEIFTNSGGIVLPVVISQQLHIVYVYNDADTCTVFHTTSFSVEDLRTLQKTVERFCSRSRRKLGTFKLSVVTPTSVDICSFARPMISSLLSDSESALLRLIFVIRFLLPGTM